MEAQIKEEVKTKPYAYDFSTKNQDEQRPGSWGWSNSNMHMQKVIFTKSVVGLDIYICIRRASKTSLFEDKSYLIWKYFVSGVKESIEKVLGSCYSDESYLNHFAFSPPTVHL